MNGPFDLLGAPAPPDRLDQHEPTCRLTILDHQPVLDRLDHHGSPKILTTLVQQARTGAPDHHEPTYLLTTLDPGPHKTTVSLWTY